MFQGLWAHRPRPALREAGDDPNDLYRLAAICWTCNERKTPRDIKEIARAKRLAEKHQEHLTRQSMKVPGRRLPSRTQWRRLERQVERQVAERTPSLSFSGLRLLGRPKGSGSDEK